MRECPDCGERCAQAWCGFCERALPRIEDTSVTLPRVEPTEVAAALGATPVKRRGCAFGECDDPQCYFCVVMPVKFRVVPCPRTTVEGERCRFVIGHPGLCKPPAGATRQPNLVRDGAPKTKRRDPTFTPRRRVGPQR